MREQAEAQFQQAKNESERNAHDRFAKAIELMQGRDAYQQLGGIANLRAMGTEPDNPFIQAITDIRTHFICQQTPQLKIETEKCFL